VGSTTKVELTTVADRHQTVQLRTHVELICHVCATVTAIFMHAILASCSFIVFLIVFVYVLCCHNGVIINIYYRGWMPFPLHKYHTVVEC